MMGLGKTKPLSCKCLVCEEGQATLIAYSDTFIEPKTKQETVVGGLEAYQCDHCGSDYLPPDCISDNSDRIQKAFLEVSNASNIIWRNER